MRDDDQPTFGALFQMYRKQAGLTQAELAAQVGLTAAAISAYETGVRRPPRLDHLVLIFNVLRLSSEEQDLLRAAAARDRVKVSGMGSQRLIRQGRPSPELLAKSSDFARRTADRARTLEAREAVHLFEEWYLPQLKGELEASLSITVWRPHPEPNGPIAEKRREILVELGNLGHDAVLSPIPIQSEDPLDAETERTVTGLRDDIGLNEVELLDTAELILILAEDDPVVIGQVLALCTRMDILPNVRAMIPKRYEFAIAGELDTLINGFQGVLWYEDYDVKASNLVKEALRCSEARRKVKAFVRFSGVS